MVILALDTSLGACSVAVADATTGSVMAVAVEPMARGHAERLMPMVGEVLKAASCRLADCSRFVSTVGPGSFTGIRVAIAAARGFAVATGRPAVGVSTLHALAHDLTGTSGTVLAIIDARHAHAYGGLFGLEGPRGPAGYRSFAEWAHEGAACTAGVTLAGTGTEHVARNWPTGAMAQPSVMERAFAPIASVIALGRDIEPALAPASPDYLKAVDARMMLSGPGAVG